MPWCWARIPCRPATRSATCRCSARSWPRPPAAGPSWRWSWPGGAATLEPLFLAAGPRLKLTDVPGGWDLEADKAEDPGLPEAGPHSVLIAPDAESGMPAGSALQQVLEGLRSRADDSRLGMARATRSLAYVLDRSIETVEVGLNGGLRCRAEPFGPGTRRSSPRTASWPLGSFSPVDLPGRGDRRRAAWSTVAFDRQRLADRLNDLRIWPWGEAEGEGALLRLAAAKAAVSRLVDGTPEIVAAGDAGRPDRGRRHLGLHAALGRGPGDGRPRSKAGRQPAGLRPGPRLLGPLGNIPEEEERRLMLRDLASDVLMPLGSLILPAGIRQGRSAGRMRVSGGPVNSDIDLQPGGIWSVELAPGPDCHGRDGLQGCGPPHDARQALQPGGCRAGWAACSWTCATYPLRLPDRVRREAVDVGGLAARHVAGDRRMSPSAKASDAPPPAYLRISARRILAVSPVIRFCLRPGDRALVAPGQPIEAGTPIAERTLDVEHHRRRQAGRQRRRAAPRAAAARDRPRRSLPAPVWKSSSEPDAGMPQPAPRPQPDGGAERSPRTGATRRSRASGGSAATSVAARRPAAATPDAGRRDAALRAGRPLAGGRRGAAADRRWRPRPASSWNLATASP